MVLFTALEKNSDDIFRDILDWVWDLRLFKKKACLILVDTIAQEHLEKISWNLTHILEYEFNKQIGTLTMTFNGQLAQN